MTIDKRQLCELWQQAFDDPEEVPENFLRTAFSPERCETVEKDGAIGAVLYWLDCSWEGKKLAYIYAVATREELRGQGLCRLLMDKTHEKLKTLGYAGAVLVPAKDNLFTMYEKMGYKGCCPMEKRVVLPGAVSAKVEKISPEEYEQLRSARLPDGSVLQGQDALAFYGTYGAFYRCGSGIFCAAREKDTLYVQEFLGDPEELPDIVAAFDCSAAQARFPGGDKPFAMYYSFTEDQALPEYFGIALD